ncbi:hypothetical protein E9531_02275 [Lampropedia puyangensis]|uniref:Uncharacterized protein n=1 Tax=Lampropedia puyangensis TaxID=1330072 RepID=A0A4S8FEU1_9BURK|nr:hypothetical protein [Lampropedia puyangensis]THU05385.1 hypothetical protein E9531_02275 [Lampropedia puyangensis]
MTMAAEQSTTHDRSQPWPFHVDLWFGDETVSSRQRTQAQAAFGQALVNALGNVALVLPIYHAFLRIIQTQGTGSADTIDVDNLSDAERHVFESWRIAEVAALEAVFGAHRQMGEGLYEIKPLP